MQLYFVIILITIFKKWKDWNDKKFGSFCFSFIFYKKKGINMAIFILFKKEKANK